MSRCRRRIFYRFRNRLDLAASRGRWLTPEQGTTGEQSRKSFGFGVDRFGANLNHSTRRGGRPRWSPARRASAATARPRPLHPPRRPSPADPPSPPTTRRSHRRRGGSRRLKLIRLVASSITQASSLFVGSGGRAGAASGIDDVVGFRANARDASDVASGSSPASSTSCSATCSWPSWASTLWKLPGMTSSSSPSLDDSSAR